jgi:hypothetical protein
MFCKMLGLPLEEKFLLNSDFLDHNYPWVGADRPVGW